MTEDDDFPFVGRLAEKARANYLLRQAGSSQESLNMLVTGDRGIGKTRFLEEVVNMAAGFKYKVLLHHCQKWNRYQPFSTVAALLRSLLGKPPGWTPRTEDTVSRIISERFPRLPLDKRQIELLYWVAGGTDVSERTLNLDERSRRGILMTVFGELVDHQMANQPSLLIAIDDIHHSDEFSRDYFLTAPFGRGVVLMISVPSSKLLPIRIEANNLKLGPFSLDEVESLLSTRFGEDFPVDDFARYCLLNGLDELDFLLEQEERITTYEESKKKSLFALIP